MHYFWVHPISTLIFRRLAWLYCYTPPVAGEEERGLEHITLGNLPFPAFILPSILKAMGEKKNYTEIISTNKRENK